MLRPKGTTGQAGGGSMGTYGFRCALAVVFLGLVVSSSGAGEAPSLPNQRQGVFVARDFKFQSGETLPDLKLGYTTLGTAQRDANGNIANAVLLLHGTTGTGANWLAPSLAEPLFRE